ncbi:MAG: hypothetical protein ACOCZQ_03275 [Nanoarchaeota archaeon]
MSYISELMGLDKLFFALLVALVLYWLISSKGRKKTEGDFDKYYREVINSDKYKVKGQYDSK